MKATRIYFYRHRTKIWSKLGVAIDQSIGKVMTTVLKIVQEYPLSMTWRKVSKVHSLHDNKFLSSCESEIDRVRVLTFRNPTYSPDLVFLVCYLPTL